MASNSHRILILEASELPDMQLSANSRRRLHYTTVATLTRSENVAWYYRLIRQVQVKTHPLPLGRVNLTWELTYPTRRIPDDDNVQSALKPLRDTLCVAKWNSSNSYHLGVIPDDSPAHVVATTLVQRYERGVRRTRIILVEEQCVTV